MREVTIVTDGSCIGNPGPGGWACILRCGNEARELSGSNGETTSNRMELMAAIEGLRALKAPCLVHLVSFCVGTQKLTSVVSAVLLWPSRGHRTSVEFCGSRGHISESLLSRADHE
ncbi:MAG: ribonuclease HI [Acidobacteria bacterium]|nr:MAG: ribonuclease HI [Acidobacteriota bacterium]